MTTRPDRVRVTGLLVGGVTGSTELGILGLCSGNVGVLELSSWLALWLVEESWQYWFVAHLAGLDWTEWCHAGEFDFGDICGHQLQLHVCSCVGLHCLK